MQKEITCVLIEERVSTTFPERVCYAVSEYMQMAAAAVLVLLSVPSP